MSWRTADWTATLPTTADLVIRYRELTQVTEALMKRSAKLFCVILMLACVCTVFTSCGMKLPDYLLMFGRDNGWVAAYRAYLRIDGDKVTKITQWSYDNYILGKDDYGYLEYDIHSFDAVADSSDPDEWEYVQNKYDTEEYDVEPVKEMLTEMGVEFTGDIYIILYDCEDITIVSVEMLDNSTIKDSRYGLFLDGKMLEVPNNVDMRDLREIYRLKNIS